ncbi:MAG: DUF927 domain-containing protein [Pseudomonadota bacterium]|nr:DUF927 domain-containing protein [Pseudomonadota bacterium]
MSPITPDLIRAALAHVSPACGRDEWAKVAMAIKSEYPDATGFDLFDRWSQGAADQYDAQATRATWRSVKAAGGVGIGTLLQKAKEGGFTLPKGQEPGHAPDAAALAEQQRQRQARQAQEQARTQAAQAQAAQLAAEQWAAASEGGASPYLVRKGVQAHGLRFAADGVALVPLRDGAGKLWNLQTIAPQPPADGGSDKRFLRGGRKSGLWHWCGPAPAPGDAGSQGDAPPPVLCVGEGYATCASVHEATGYPVAVAFDAGNLAHVAKALRGLYPRALIVVCGDDDAGTAARTGVNAGRSKAESAARAVRGVAVFPAPLPEGGSDFNDLHHASGLPAVRACVDAAVQAAMQARAAPKAGRQAPTQGAADAGDGPGPDPFTVTPEGVFFQGFDREGKPARPLWICSRLEVTALTRNTDRNGWGYLLSFADPEGRPREWAMPARMLAGDGGEYRAMLQDMGLRIAPGAAVRNRLGEYLQTRNPEARATCVDRSGWHPAGEGAAVYVLPGEAIGDAAERVVYQSDAAVENPFRVRGSLAAWQERIGALCVGNHRLLFAVACAFAGPLLRPAGVDSGGFHFRGDSSSGKTTALRAAASVNGAPGYMQRWRTTDNALESIAAQHCDALLILDELAQVDGKVAGECAYMLANESSKARASRGGAPRQRLTWRLLFLSAGELGLADHMAEAMKRARTGQEVRMVDLSADAGAGMGLFEALHGREGPAALAMEITRSAAAVYGAPGRAWLQWLAPQWPGLPRLLRDRMDALRAAWVPEGASGQVERVATRFALVAVAGELATEAGLTGWPQGESTRAVRTCFEAWLAQRGGAGNLENVQMARQVRGFIAAHGEGRFTWWHRAADDHNAKTLHRAGFRRMVMPDGTPINRNAQHGAEIGDHMPADLGEEMRTDYFILPDVFRAEVCQGFDYKSVCRVLLEHGCLHTDKGGGFDRKMRLPGVGLSRCYHINGEALMGLSL